MRLDGQNATVHSRPRRVAYLHHLAFEWSLPPEQAEALVSRTLTRAKLARRKARA